jgi:hypothetical protein
MGHIAEQPSAAGFRATEAGGSLKFTSTKLNPSDAIHLVSK